MTKSSGLVQGVARAILDRDAAERDLVTHPTATALREYARALALYEELMEELRGVSG